MFEDIFLSYIRYSPLYFGKSYMIDILNKLPRKTVRVRTSDGFYMDVNTSDFIQNNIYLTLRWDEGVANAIRSKLVSGNLFVDVGANVGYFSLLAAKLGANVIAFEPNPNCVEVLKSNIKLNNFSIDVRPVGLAEKKYSSFLNIEDELNVGAGSLKTTAGEGIPIVLDNMDDQLNGLVPELIKIDIEGSETKAFRGADYTLKYCPTVICEVSEYSLKMLGSSKDELFDIMKQYDFKSEIISLVRRSNSTTDSVYFQYDVLFTK